MRWADVGAVVATVLAGSVYVAAVAAQGPPVERMHLIVAGSTVAAVGTAGAGLLVAGGTVRSLLFGWTALTTLAWAVLGAASVGIAYLPAAALAGAAAGRARAQH